jgi:hypothetical protein
MKRYYFLLRLDVFIPLLFSQEKVNKRLCQVQEGKDANNGNENLQSHSVAFVYYIRPTSAFRKQLLRLCCSISIAISVMAQPVCYFFVSWKTLINIGRSM